jgi:hypothetical protein
MDGLTANRRYGRLLLKSTVLLTTLSVVRSQLCGKDEFYDAVARHCTLCSDVCRPQPQTHSYCRINCPVYHDRMMAQLASNPVTSPTTSPTMTSSTLLTVLQTHPSTFQSPYMADSPLIGIIIGCLVVMAAVVITTMLVLCVVLRRAAIRYGSVVDSEVGSNSNSSSCKSEDTSTAWTKASDKSLCGPTGGAT